MAGFGALPKDPSKRARTNKDPNPTTTLRFERGKQPELPADLEWPPQTHRWWKAWGDASIAGHFTQLEWEYLLGTALLHKKLWEKESTEAAKELRLREEAFGVTLAARLRLRIQWAEAEEADPTPVAGSTARERYGPLRAVPAPEPASS